MKIEKCSPSKISTSANGSSITITGYDEKTQSYGFFRSNTFLPLSARLITDPNFQVKA